MLIGVLFSAVTGGLAGMAWSIVHGHDLPRLLLSYPLGGTLAVLAFILLSSLHSKVRQTQFFERYWF